MSLRSPSPRRRRSPARRLACIAGLAAGLAAGFAAPTSAQSARSACLAHDKLAEMLDGQYAERPVAFGLEASGRLFEVFAADDGATWTMVITTPKGASCVVAVGEEWQTPQQLAFDPEM